ncbi:lytic transglycosylase domain-containing protein, partial [Yersinia enterocolitica]
MAAKSIIDIDVNDDKFQSFMEKFNEYQNALNDLPDAWRGVAQGIGDTEKETAKARSELQGVAKSFSDGAAAILSINS